MDIAVLMEAECAIVPRHADSAMMSAGVEAAKRQKPDVEGNVGHVQIRAAWDAMLKAAPSRLPLASSVEAQGGVEDFATESANASLIVRAVNSHDALVEALEKLTVWVNETYVVEDCRHDRDPDCMSCQAIVLVDAACKAIASAKGTTE